MIRRLFGTATRMAQLAVVRGSTRMIDGLRQKTMRLEIRLDGLHKGLALKEVAAIPCPEVDLAAADDAVTAIMNAPEFPETIQFFADNPAAERSLVPPDAHALLYSLVRNLKPEHAFEIGTFKGGTSEAICRALAANGTGVLHTVDPFRSDYIKTIFANWPAALLSHLRCHPTYSMAFFGAMEREGIRPALVFVDGNHDYEFAAFDIACGARLMQRGGFMVIDNIAQPGPFYAALDFLAANPAWREHGRSTQAYDPTKAFDRRRTSIANTDFMILAAPRSHSVGARPWNGSLIRTRQHVVTGLRVKLARPSGPGKLSAQVVLRGFGATLVEELGEASVAVMPGQTEIEVTLAPPARLDGMFAYHTIEPWLIWNGAEPLHVIDAQPL
jgi:predicted O-methyltransferase YrrM